MNKTVLVLHEVNSGSRGIAPRLERSPKVHEQVRECIEYGDGRVKDSAGDIWSVLPCRDARATYQTVGK